MHALVFLGRGRLTAAVGMRCYQEFIQVGGDWPIDWQ